MLCAVPLRFDGTLCADCNVLFRSGDSMATLNKLHEELAAAYVRRKKRGQGTPLTRIHYPVRPLNQKSAGITYDDFDPDDFVSKYK